MQVGREGGDDEVGREQSGEEQNVVGDIQID